MNKPHIIHFVDAAAAAAAFSTACASAASPSAPVFATSLAISATCARTHRKSGTFQPQEFGQYAASEMSKQ
jgi:hypothetical protein